MVWANIQATMVGETVSTVYKFLTSVKCTSLLI